MVNEEAVEEQLPIRFKAEITSVSLVIDEKKPKSGFNISLVIMEGGNEIARVTRTYKQFKELAFELRQSSRNAPELPSKFGDYDLKLGAEQLKEVLETYLN